MTDNDNDFSATEGTVFSGKALRKALRQVVVSSAILVILIPLLVGIAYFDIDPIWGLILTVAVVGIYIVRVMHEGQYRLAHRVESLAILLHRTNEENRHRNDGS